MRATYILPDQKASMIESFIQFDADNEVQSVIFLMADKDAYESTTLASVFKNFNKPIIGGIFPELIHKGERKSEGILIIQLPFKLNTLLFDLTQTSEQFLSNLHRFQIASPDTPSSVFVFTDALAPRKEAFIHALFNFYGIYPTYIGGSTGSLSFQPIPSIINNEGIHPNSAVIGWVDKKMALGVAHGWNSISEPLKITGVDKYHLTSLNWQPAFNVYKRIVETHSGSRFDDENFFSIARSYPLGISKMDAEKVVRDPFRVSGDSLILVDQVNEGEYIEILCGDMNSLLQGARHARQMAINLRTPNMDQQGVFCIDCISRALFMEHSFNQELQLVGQGLEVNGMLSIGEIANSEASFLEIYNKTVVVGIW